MTNSRFRVRVQEIKEESPAVKRFKLVPTDECQLPRFSAGSHITTYVNDNIHPFERSYSLISPPDVSDCFEIAIRLDEKSKGGSLYWHTKMKEGDILEISYPKNHFAIEYEAKHHVFFAAGIGITPFLSMARELKQKSLSFELHYAAPSKLRCAFYSFLASHYPNETEFYFSNERKKMTTSIMKWQKVGSHVYFCGPSEMIKQFTEDALKFGYPEQNIHYELFTPLEQGPANGFQVRLKKTGLNLTVPKDKSLLDVLLEHKINVPFSCKIGGCGTCQIEVLQGGVSHRDLFLSLEEKKEGNVILACVSRARGERLIVDL